MPWGRGAKTLRCWNFFATNFAKGMAPALPILRTGTSKIATLLPVAEPKQRIFMDPYHASANSELDLSIAKIYFLRDLPRSALSYSTDLDAAERLKSRLEVLFGSPVVTGRTRTRSSLAFARLEKDPSTAPQVLAETYPLAVARLALLLERRLGVTLPGMTV